MKENDDTVIESDGTEELGKDETELVEDEALAGDKLKKFRTELQVAKTERQEYLDGWQRAKADYANLIRRTEEEKKAERSRGIAKAAEAFLPAIDALERAKAHGDIPEGFSGIVRQLETAFDSLGLTAIGQIGESFDPNLHEALGKDLTSKKEEDDTITAVLETGWKSGETLVRPAKVRVAHYEQAD